METITEDKTRCETHFLLYFSKQTLAKVDQKTLAGRPVTYLADIIKDAKLLFFQAQQFFRELFLTEISTCKRENIQMKERSQRTMKSNKAMQKMVFRHYNP